MTDRLKTREARKNLLSPKSEAAWEKLERELLKIREITMDARDILEAELKKKGFDGLYQPDGECGCKVGELAPCGESCLECLPGYRCLIKDLPPASQERFLDEGYTGEDWVIMKKRHATQTTREDS